MKTPSFLELQSLVEYLSEELEGSQLQEVQSTEEGLVLAFYRFDKNPRMSYLVFDLDRAFPFVGFFFENPWAKQKKTKPVALFLNAHAKNLLFNTISVSEALGRVACAPESPASAAPESRCAARSSSSSPWVQDSPGAGRLHR